MNALALCFELRQCGYRPYRIMRTPLGRVELISYPYPESGAVYIKARREIGNPDSIATFQLVPNLEGQP